VTEWLKAQAFGLRYTSFFLYLLSPSPSPYLSLCHGPTGHFNLLKPNSEPTLHLSQLSLNKSVSDAGYGWLTPVILATQEAEIRRITVQSQPRQIVQETLHQKTHHKKGLVEWLKW
jgi:hypothetical protein